ncbi:unnamed protein product, partial [Staurois parvus]
MVGATRDEQEKSAGIDRQGQQRTKKDADREGPGQTQHQGRVAVGH